MFRLRSKVCLYKVIFSNKNRPKTTMNDRHALDSTINPNRVNPRPTGLPDAPEDKVTRVLHKYVPLHLQHRLRDSGTLRSIMDNSAIFLAGGLGLTHPSAIGKYLELGQCLEVYSYGNVEEKRLHIYRYNQLHRNRTSSMSSTPSSSSAPSSSSSASVMIFVHGGAWGSGKPWHYRLMVEKLAQCVGASYGVVIEYPVYPKSRILEQADSVYEAMRYMRSNASILKLPPHAQFVLAAHSSGANICALAIVKSVDEELQPALTDCFVGLAGVYDIEKHFLFEATRGVHEISPMAAAAIHRDRFGAVSPSCLIPRVCSEKIRRYWPLTLFLHGQLDSTVPFTSSKELAEHLLSKGGTGVETCFPLEYGHVEPILHMTVGGTTSKTFTAIQDFYNKHLRQKQPIRLPLSSTNDHHQTSNLSPSLRSKL